MATRIIAALLFALPAIYRLWYHRDNFGDSAYSLIIGSVIMLVIAAGLLFRQKWGYHAARVALWILLGLSVLSVAGFSLVEVEGIREELFMPRALSVSLLTILFAVWLLVMLNRENVKKDFGIG
jgi:hypothetical protein